MKRIQWKNLARFGGVGCAILGATAAIKCYVEEKKLNDNLNLIGYPRQALCSNIMNQNPNANATTTELTIRKQSTADFAALEAKRINEGVSEHSKPKDILTLEEAIEKASVLCQRVRDRYGLPGLTVGVSVNGTVVWEQGFGYGDIENSVPMNPRMIMRIASISKSMTMAMMGKLMDQDLIDLDAPIQTYLPQFPIKYVDGKQVNITTRHLVTHLSGIRHYEKKGEKSKEIEMNLKEYFIKDHYDSVEKSLELFQNDELLHEPGTKYLYTTHGWTVVSAIIEKIVKRPFEKHAKITFNIWGLKNTYLDEHQPIIHNRVRYYTRDKEGVLENSPYVDNSYKWAGGGFLSNAADLLQFAHILLYSLQSKNKESKNIPFLTKDTTQKLWTGDPRAIRLFLGAPSDTLYGMGFIVQDTLQKCMFCKTEDLVTISHGGAAIGASSILLVKFPKLIENRDTDEKCNNDKKDDAIEGVVVAMLTNLTNVSLSATANEIGNLFKQLL